MSTLLVTNLANICDTARFTAEKQFFISNLKYKISIYSRFFFFSSVKHFTFENNK